MDETTAALLAQISERKCRRTVETLARHGFTARYCATAADAADALLELGAGAKTVGFDGSPSIAELGVRERFAAAGRNKIVEGGVAEALGLAPRRRP